VFFDKSSAHPDPAMTAQRDGGPKIWPHLYVALFLLTASACSGGSSTPTAPTPVPSPTPSPTPPTTIVLTGQVTDRITSAPISGATVIFDGKNRTTTDSSGSYALTGLRYAASIINVLANNYAGDARYIQGTSHNVRLYRIERITAGDSWSVTVAPDDSLCYNNVQDQPGAGQDYVCRSVRVVAPADGIMTLEAVSTQGGAHPPLEVETVGVLPCCSERMGNPTSIQVTVGTEVIANVEIVLGSTISQSFTLNTSMARP
jgi:hypothetical protein